MYRHSQRGLTSRATTEDVERVAGDDAVPSIAYYDTAYPTARSPP
jgi:hypothetical protein